MSHQPTTETSVGQVLDGKYRLDTLLGQDGVVKLFRATHIDFNKTFLIKVSTVPAVKEASKLRFYREASFIIPLDHPNIVKLVDRGITAGNLPYLVMDHFEAQTLRELIGQEGKLPERMVLNIAKQICAGLHVVHQNQIFHSQLQPESILIERLSNGDLIARITNIGIDGLFLLESNDQTTKKEELLGKMKYMAPEQFLDELIDARSDLFSVCLIIYEMLTGVVPAAAMSLSQPLRELRPDVSPDLHELIHKGLSQNPSERPANMLDLKRELESVEPNVLSDATTQFSTDRPLSPGKHLVTIMRTLIIGQMLSHYHIIQKIGEGGMGEVYLAEDKRLRRKVALKLLPIEITSDIERVRRFELEARTASALNHPNILTIYEIGEADGIHFIATEYINGHTLRQLIEDKLELFHMLDIALQIASALSAAHPAGVVHRDIKPGNIMVRPDGYVKVLDFGLAKFTEQAAAGNTGSLRALEQTDQSEIGRIMGTPKYMSPEQARGLNVDARTDIFSLGVVLYEMVCGEPPFTGETNTDLIVALLEREPLPLTTRVPDLPVELSRIIHKALRKAPDERYQSVKDLHSDLKSLKHRLDLEELGQSISGSVPFLEPRSGINEPRTSDNSLRGLSSVANDPTEKVVPLAEEAKATTRGRGRKRLYGTIIGLSLVTIMLALLVGYQAFWRQSGATARGAQMRSLAILPFRNLKPDNETDFLGFSLADAVITKLSYLQSLTVRPSSAIDKFRNQSIDTHKVAADLRVNTLMVGSYLKEGNDLRITIQLIEVNNDEIIWRDTLDLKYEKLITVQNRVADEIVQGLELKLTMAETERLQRDIPQNPLAYEYCLRGRDLMTLSANNFRMATEMLEKSVALDPNYALAWAYLGYTYSSNATAQFGGREFYAKAQAAYDRALALDPDQIEARIFTSLLMTDTGRVEQAIPILQSAIKTNPNLARAHWELSYAYRYAGMLKESIAEGERALALDADVANRTFNSYFYDGQFDKFIKSLPNREDAYFIFYRGLGYYYLKDYDKAIEAFDRAYQLTPGVVFTQIGKAMSYAIKKENDKGLEMLKESEARIEERGVSDGEVIYKIAQTYAALGDKPAALRNLRRSIELGFFCYPYFLHDQLMDDLRNEPEYNTVMQLARKRHEDVKQKFF